jgi:hypothetical protein
MDSRILGLVTVLGFLAGPTVASAGVVTFQAPEIDPTSAASGLTLLLGTLVVLRGRRSVKPDNAAP